jgi:hypothetical protein
MSLCIFDEHLWQFYDWFDVWALWEWNGSSFSLVVISDLFLASFEFPFQRTPTWINLELKKQGMPSWVCVWTWTHNVCRKFSAQCNLQIIGIFTCMELIWNFDFKFGGHKIKTTYIPSNQIQDFINGEEHCNDANCKFTHWQLIKNERRELLFP